MGRSRRGRDGTTWNNIKQMMGDPFRVDSGDIEKIRGCIQLRFMHPRLLRVVPFRDMHRAHCCAFRRLAACVPGNETPHPGLRQISF